MRLDADQISEILAAAATLSLSVCIRFKYFTFILTNVDQMWHILPNHNIQSIHTPRRHQTIVKPEPDSFSLV
jgi:hypothetical protein